jgi:hypothetical protein
LPFIPALCFRGQEPQGPNHFSRRAAHWFFTSSTIKGKYRIFLLFLFLPAALIGAMSSTLLRVSPSELKIPCKCHREPFLPDSVALLGAFLPRLIFFLLSVPDREDEVKRQRSCCMQLMNKTDKYVAFKVNTLSLSSHSAATLCGALGGRRGDGFQRADP